MGNIVSLMNIQRVIQIIRNVVSLKIRTSVFKLQDAGVYFISVPSLPETSSTSMENLIFQDRFDGGLSAWTLEQAFGTVTTETKDCCKKLALNSTSATKQVSATYTFTEPERSYLVEIDGMAPTGTATVLEMLDTSGNVAISVEVDSTSGVVFDTDSNMPSSLPLIAGTYTQIVLHIDPTSKLATCWMNKQHQAVDFRYLEKVSVAKAYSTKIVKARIRSGTGKIGVSYADEFRIYTPGICVIGDSIADGKKFWSCEPSSTHRLAASVDQTSSPSYVLSRLIGTNAWVGNRAWGGSQLWQHEPLIQDLVDQGFKTIMVICGHNDIYNGLRVLADMQSSVNNIIDTLIAAGFSGKNIFFSNVAPSALINSPTKIKLRDDYNAWIDTRMSEIGGKVIDCYSSLRSTGDHDVLNALCADTDNVHLNKTGSEVLGLRMYSSLHQSVTNMK